MTGPSGCGKTSLVKIIAKECDAFLIQVGDSVHGARPGESEQNLRAAFLQATTACMEGSCILFLDDIDAICPRCRDNSDGLARRMLAELLSLLEKYEHVSRLMIIAATSKPSEIDPCLRRVGRFEKEVKNSIKLSYFPIHYLQSHCLHMLRRNSIKAIVCRVIIISTATVYLQIFLGIPDEFKRHDILKVIVPHGALANDVDLYYLAQATPGFTGADLSSFVRFAMTQALERWASSDHKVKAVLKYCIGELCCFLEWIMHKH